jgi:hypothetical protein
MDGCSVRKQYKWIIYSSIYWVLKSQKLELGYGSNNLCFYGYRYKASSLLNPREKREKSLSLDIKTFKTFTSMPQNDRPRVYIPARCLLAYMHMYLVL